MSNLDRSNLQDLATWLDGRRWYGDKGRRLKRASTTLGAEAKVSGRNVSIEIARLEYDHGEPASYLLVHDRALRQVDGIESADLRSWILDGFFERRVLTGGEHGSITWATIAVDRLMPRSLDEESTVFGGEQSNTSIVYGERSILKLFRRLRPGLNPEVEIGAYLTEHTSFSAFPRLLGTITASVDGNEMTLAALQEFIPNSEDAWTWLTTRLIDPDQHPGTLDAIRLLGVRTGELHVALASAAGGPFSPEPASEPYCRSMLSEARHELRDTLLLLERHFFPGVAELGVVLSQKLEALEMLKGTTITRIHGDYHLGQVLRTPDGDFRILDFEGEPTRSLPERRARSSPLRDVAGMLRSLDYAAETARRSAGANVSAIDAWLTDARAEFLSGYESAALRHSRLDKSLDTDERAAVLDAFEVHKALYEVRYELGNRPDWVDIPLSALHRIASQSGNPGPT